MNKKDSLTLGFLTILTIATALLATTFNNLKYVALFILGLSIVKFLLVAFQFMELKKAHIMWKASIIIYLSIFFIVMLIVLPK